MLICNWIFLNIAFSLTQGRSVVKSSKVSFSSEHVRAIVKKVKKNSLFFLDDRPIGVKVSHYS